MSREVRVRQRTLEAGPGGVFAPGRERTLPAAEAEAAIAAGAVELVDPPPAPRQAKAPETAEAPAAPETAETPRGETAEVEAPETAEAPAKGKGGRKRGRKGGK